MIEVAVYNDLQHEQFTSGTGRFVLRQADAAPQLWTFGDCARLSETVDGIYFTVSKTKVTLESTQTTASICTANGDRVSSGDSLSLPCVLQLDNTWIKIAPHSEPRQLVPLLPTELINFSDAETSGEDHWDGPSSETITHWLTAAGKLHRAAANSPLFFADAARFAVETIGLDAAWVLARFDDECRDTCPKKCCDEWRIVGSCLPSPADGVCFDRLVLDQIHQQSVAWYQPTSGQANVDENANTPNPVVLAPILDGEGQLVAAIYGVRTTQNKNRRLGIRPLEARLIQLLAESVGVGIARLEQETEAARARVLLEQAFSPTVADYIQEHPESLSGQEREITLLFADLRGYTAIAETISTADCYALLGDVMETLTDVVMQNGGVVVDYYGDGLLAIWNAPLDQPNHPDLACTAALEMFGQLPDVAGNWEALLDRPLELGIGIHTGPAHVGNAGTRSRIKYGPRGNTVNVASRVQAASKQLQLPLVITAATQTKLSDKFFALRTCTAKLPGLAQPIELYTTYPASEAQRVKTRLDQYAHALQFFEEGNLNAAEELLSELVALGPVTPAKFLAHYTAAKKKGQLSRRTADKHKIFPSPVIEILGK
jgi:adenylate cyclase